MPELESLYHAWQAAVAVRSGRGELRASREEVASLSAYLDALEHADESTKVAWQERRADLEPTPHCACGHPLPHHDASGRCFHVVGCATVCDCSRQ